MKRFLVTILLALFVAGRAFALTCAHVETGQALDVQSCQTTADYLKRYTAAVTAGWVASIVPDGTLHNAVDNGNGTFTNPVVRTPPPQTTVSVTDFKKRFTLAEKVAIAGSSDMTVKVFWDELNTASTVDLTDNDTVGGVDYLVTINLLTVDRAAAILNP